MWPPSEDIIFDSIKGERSLYQRMSFERQIRSEHFEIAITKSFLKIHFAIVLSEFHDE